MLIAKQDLARLLAATVKVVETRNTIPILSTVRLVAKDGKISITATDLVISATATADATGDLAVCVDAKLFGDIVKRAGDAIDLTHNDGTLTIATGKSRFKLPTLPVGDFPDFTAGDMTTAFTTNLAALFKPVSFAISTEETRYYLNGIYLHALDGKLAAVATDGHRLGRNIGGPVAEFSGVIVPRKTVGLIPEGEIGVMLSATKIQFAALGLVITSKLIDGTFPDYQRILPTGNDKLLHVDRDALRAAVDRVSTVSSERGRAVKLTVADDAVRLEVSNPEQGSATDEVSAGYSDAPVEIGFNAAYIGELLAQFPAGEVIVALNDSGSPALFKCDKAEGYLAVCMPMRTA